MLSAQMKSPITPSPGVKSVVPPGGVIAFLTTWDKEPRAKLNVRSVAGKITIVKFSDWECPACKATAIAYKPTFDALGAKIQYVEKDYPLNHECNAYVQQTIPGHEASCMAAAAMRLARANRGNADALGSWLFANQDATPAAVAMAAFDVGGVRNLSSLYPTLLPAIRNDTDEGGALKLTGTPGYFINGAAVMGFDNGKLEPHNLLLPDLFDAAVQHEIQKAAIR